MAKEKEEKQRQPMPSIGAWGPAVALGWLIPGGGHLLLKRARRAAGGFDHRHVRLRAHDARRHVSTAVRGSADHPDQHRRIHRRRLFRHPVPADLLARVYPARHSRGRSRLRNEVSGDRGAVERAGDGGCLRNRRGEEKLMTMNLSHFEAAVLFSLFTSVVMGIVTKSTDRERVQYGGYVFVCFMVALFGIGWVMQLGHG